MNITRTICKIKQRYGVTNVYRLFQISPINHNFPSVTRPQEEYEKCDFEDFHRPQRQYRKKPQIKPFMKDVFLSIFNQDLLTYPEILNKEEFEKVNNEAFKLQTIFFEKPSKADRINALRKAKMYSATMSLADNGLEINTTESVRYLESISSDLQLSLEVCDHWISLAVLQEGLKPNCHQNIKKDLASGDYLVSLCIQERLPENLTHKDFRTHAVIDGTGTWHINGEKVSHNSTGYFLVLCIVNSNQLKAFLVPPDAEGINYNNGFVAFSNTPAIPIDLLTEEKLGRILAISRLYAATLLRCCLTNAMHRCVEYVRPLMLSDKSHVDLPTIKTTVGNTLMHLYASESAEYFTAGLHDGYESSDVELETAMCRNFMAKNGTKLLLDLLNICTIGQQNEYIKMLQDFQFLASRGEALDGVSMFISLNGIHHAGVLMANEIKQMRNPLNYPGFILKKAFQDKYHEIDKPRLNLHLKNHLHPSLKQSASELEYCVLRMRFASETLLTRHGQEVITARTELNRLAEAATDILAMTAVLSRASRSLNTRCKNADFEMKLATSFVSQTKLKVQELILDIDDGHYVNLDFMKMNIGQKTLDNSILIMNPTTRVWW